eukprot:jgi/Botrbrau1/22701/Bobra.0132s0040.1
MRCHSFSAAGMCTRYQVFVDTMFLPSCSRVASTTNVPNLRFGAGKEALVDGLLAAKEASGKTFSQIAEETGLTNLYTAQLFYGQAQLKPDREASLRQAVPALTQDQVDAIKRCPNRSFHPQIVQEPLVYRFTEAIHHYGESIKAICNEECGDGIMSAIDMYSSVSVITGVHGEKRVVVTLNGKWLPHVEQNEKDNTAVLQSTK